MKFPEFEERYRQLMSIPLSELSQYNDDERVGLLYREKSIRIFLIRSTICEKKFKIEVEFQTCPPMERLSEREEISILDTMISDIHYLKELVFQGFQLDFIENSCIWTLQKEFFAVDLSDLRLLLPP